MNIKPRKNYEIELYRFVMILGVALFHFYEDCSSRIYVRGYLGVDFFFVVSGYFLMIHFMRHYNAEESATKQAVEYIADKFKKLYPPYFIALVLMTLIVWVHDGADPINLFLITWVSKWQYFLLHSVGAPTVSLIRSTWFMSPLFLISFFLYFCLCHKKDLWVGLSPIITILTMAFLAQKYGILTIQFTYNGFLVGGILRGLPEMTLGVFLAYLIEEHYKKNVREYKLWVSILVRLLCYGMLFYIMVVSSMDIEDFSIFIPTCILIMYSFLHPIPMPSIVEGVCCYFGKISYWIYLIHVIVGYVLKEYFMHWTMNRRMVVYFVVTVAVAAFLDFVYSHFTKFCASHRKM